MPQHRFPPKSQLLLPLLQCLNEAGGKAMPNFLYDTVAHKIGLDQSLREERGSGGKAGEINLWERQLRNTRQAASNRGLIENSFEKRTRNLWELTEKGRQGLRNCKPGILITVFTTSLGTALLALAETAIQLIPNNSVDLILTSPPYPLTTKKAYGNLNPAAHLDWLASLASGWKEKLTDTGSLILNLADVFTPGAPAISLYQERLLLRLCDELGYTLAQKFYWENSSKMPGPAEWVCVRRIRVTPSIEQIYWLTKNPNTAKANNKLVLRPYSGSMQNRIALGGETTRHQKRPSGHQLRQGAFAIDNGGSIPHNLIIAPNTESNGRYQTRCRELGLPIHPARFPKALPSFFIQFLTEPGNLVFDPLAGSATTAEAAEDLGRRWIINERSLTYLQGAALRFEGNPNLQTYFDQLAA
jgi:DNA modification methylase